MKKFLLFLMISAPALFIQNAHAVRGVTTKGGTGTTFCKVLDTRSTVGGQSAYLYQACGTLIGGSTCTCSGSFCSITSAAGVKLDGSTVSSMQSIPIGSKEIAN